MSVTRSIQRLTVILPIEEQRNTLVVNDDKILESETSPPSRQQDLVAEDKTVGMSANVQDLVAEDKAVVMLANAENLVAEDRTRSRTKEIEDTRQSFKLPFQGEHLEAEERMENCHMVVKDKRNSIQWPYRGEHLVAEDRTLLNNDNHIFPSKER